MYEWQRIISFNDQYFKDWRQRPLVFYTNALSSEVGECCSITKVWAGGGTNPKEFSRKDLATECVDVFIYLVLTLERMGIDFCEFKTYLNLKLDTLYERMIKKALNEL